MDDEHDGDRTSPDLGESEHTNPGVGTGEAYIAGSGLADRALDALRTLEGATPTPESPGFRRHVECVAHAWGELGDLCHDERRLALQFLRERIKR